MEHIKISKENDLKTYKPSPALEQVIDMARALGRPLLLTGKPGTGKTQFAHWYARKEGFNSDVFQFNTKSTSVFSDLFYEYDAVSHFRDKKGEKTASDFIKLTAMGKAVICAKGIDTVVNPELKKIVANSGLKEIDSQKINVVLIDEVDKAPRDFPNDLLHEIEKLSFYIKEINEPVELSETQKQKIVIILTSNDEKNLPDAFLRRCLFHYIEFPDKDLLSKIIKEKLEISSQSETGVSEKVALFYAMHKNDAIDKKPSTSECIEWINYLKAKKLLDVTINEILDDETKAQFRNSLSILLKKKDDFDEAAKMLGVQLVKL